MRANEFLTELWPFTHIAAKAGHRGSKRKIAKKIYNKALTKNITKLITDFDIQHNKWPKHKLYNEYVGYLSKQGYPSSLVRKQLSNVGLRPNDWNFKKALRAALNLVNGAQPGRAPDEMSGNYQAIEDNLRKLNPTGISRFARALGMVTSGDNVDDDVQEVIDGLRDKDLDIKALQNISNKLKVAIRDAEEKAPPQQQQQQKQQNAPQAGQNAAPQNQANQQMVTDAVQALVKTGIKKQDASNFVNKATADLQGTNYDLSSLVRRAFQQASGNPKPMQPSQGSTQPAQNTAPQGTQTQTDVTGQNQDKQSVAQAKSADSKINFPKILDQMDKLLPMLSPEQKSEMLKRLGALGQSQEQDLDIPPKPEHPTRATLRNVPRSKLNIRPGEDPQRNGQGTT